jgi:hypothetical protein
MPEEGHSNDAPALSPAFSMNHLFNADDATICRIHNQIAHLATAPIQRHFGAVQVLTRDQISEALEAAFWASLRSDEGRTTKVCLSFAEPGTFQDAIAFETPASFDESHIAKLAPAVPRSGSLVVSASSERLAIWGIGRSRPRAILGTMAIDMWDPGTLRISIQPYETYAVFKGRLIFLIEGSGRTLAQYLLRVLRKELGTGDFIETQAVWRECLALAELARIIVAAGHGGMILVVPHEHGAWLNSLSSFPCKFAIPDTTIPNAIRRDLIAVQADAQRLQRLSEASIPDEIKTLAMGNMHVLSQEGDGQIIRATASMGGVDGAIVVTRNLKVLGFGAKIAVTDTAPQVCMIPPEPGPHELVPLPLERLGGTRHQSAARFAADNKDAVALVISQDRHMSVVHWDDETGCIVAVRNAESWL